MNKSDLGSKESDVVTSALKSVLGPLPVVGPMLTELIGNIVPNQRIERLEKFARILDGKISDVQGTVEKALNDDECVRLFEEAFYQASKATSDERREYIASILENGLRDDRIEYDESRYLMNLLDELTDVEVIWLRSYLDLSVVENTEFLNKHKNVLGRVQATMKSDQGTHDKEALQDSYRVHLENLGLIKGQIDKDRDGLPRYDSFTGEPRIIFRRTTPLGRLLLRHIGFRETENM